jgi:hypothetical protein
MWCVPVVHGPLMYKVKTDLGSTWRRHIDQIKPSKIAEDIAQNTPLIEEPSVETTTTLHKNKCF